MARFDIERHENISYVKATIADETIRAERGALFHMHGQIVMEAPLPRPRHFVRSLFNDESMVRPTYTGTGTVVLESSYGGFHVFDLGGETWILESGVYWASDGSVDVGVHREAVIPSLLAGEGLVDFQTKVSGEGQVVLTSDGPVEELELHDERVVTAGKYVLARSASVQYRVHRPTRSLLGRWTSGEGLLRTYSGTGRVLTCPYPFWRRRFTEGQLIPTR